MSRPAISGSDSGVLTTTGLTFLGKLITVVLILGLGANGQLDDAIVTLVLPASPDSAVDKVASPLQQQAVGILQRIRANQAGDLPQLSLPLEQVGQRGAGLEHGAEGLSEVLAREVVEEQRCLGARSPCS